MNDTDTRRLKQLEFAELARDVISRYCLALDTDDMTMLGNVFCTDVALHRPPEESLHGAEVMNFFTEVLKEKVTHRKHFNTNTVVSPPEGDMVKAQSYFFAFHHNHGQLSVAWGSYRVSVRIADGAAKIAALSIDVEVPIAPVRTMIGSV